MLKDHTTKITKHPLSYKYDVVERVMKSGTL